MSKSKCTMSYKPPYTITPKITNWVAQISEAIGSYYAHENLRLHRVNRIKTIHGTLAIEGNTHLSNIICVNIHIC